MFNSFNYIFPFLFFCFLFDDFYSIWYIWCIHELDIQSQSTAKFNWDYTIMMNRLIGAVYFWRQPKNILIEEKTSRKSIFIFEWSGAKSRISRIRSVLRIIAKDGLRQSHSVLIFIEHRGVNSDESFSPVFLDWFVGNCLLSNQLYIKSSTIID